MRKFHNFWFRRCGEIPPPDFPFCSYKYRYIYNVGRVAAWVLSNLNKIK